MAWFKFGKQDDSVKTKQGPTESVDAMRRRALFRLVGSVVLVLAGVVGFPMLFDSQPRSVPVDIPIDIPDKAKVKPLQLPGGTSSMATPAPAAKVEDSASLSGKEEIISNTTVAKSAATGAAVAGAAAVAAAAISNSDKAKADKAAADKVAADKAAKIKADKEKLAKDKAALDASRAKALLDGNPSDAKPAPAAPATKSAPPAAAAAAAAAAAGAGAERFIVQFGAFTDVVKSREVRQKVEKAGLKTYSQVAKTADGDLIRVRVGPFTSKAEADKAAVKIKALGLPASILTL
jgi:DedD protein